MSIRRRYLDESIREFEKKFIRGLVLDIGGKKTNQRGRWLPDRNSKTSWEYLNTDPETEPDYLQSAEKTLLESNTYDSVLMCEVLEYLEKPTTALREAARLLKPGGTAFITMPFLNQVHGDTGDRQRWTSFKLRTTLEGSGFEVLSINPMGSLFSVIFDLLASSLARWEGLTSRKKLARLTIRVHNLSSPLFLFLDTKLGFLSGFITTGWCATVRVLKDE